MSNNQAMSNADVAQALRELALFLELDGVAFKPRAFERAAYTVEGLARPIAAIWADGGAKALATLPAIGKGIAGRIADLLATGTLAELEALRAKTPVDLLALTRIAGVGPKTVRALWRGLGVRTVADLERAARQGRVRTLTGFGARREARLLAAVARLAPTGARQPLGQVLELAERIERRLAHVGGVERAVVAGSIRRRRDTIGDVDVLVATTAPAAASRAFTTLPEVAEVIADGPTRTAVRLAGGLTADLRVFAPASFGAALVYFTGSKAHNVALRRRAQQRGLKLNEYGVFRGDHVVAGRTEAEVYAALGLGFIPPELREDAGEVERAARGELPALIEAGEVRGDLQVHTRWTDGAATIAEMARAAHALGRSYIAITDHTRDLAMTGGLDEAGLVAQRAEVRAADRVYGGLRVLAGAEVNIRADGSLDLADDALAGLDLVGAAIHSHFDQPRAAMTRRLIRAIEHPSVDVLFHPLGRARDRRGIDCDVDAVLAACARTGTIVEIDAQPERLDLPDALVRRAVDAGVRLAIDSDAHAPAELRFIERFGLGVARRGWATRAEVVNAWPLAVLAASLKRARRPARAGQNFTFGTSLAPASAWK